MTLSTCLRYQVIVILLFLTSHGFLLSQDFTEVAVLLGVDTICNSNSLGGNGMSFADFNQDGLDDLSLCTGPGQAPVFYKNIGNRFELINPGFVTTLYEHKQINWVDYDNDGDKDLFITSSGAPNHLYENDGSLNFTIVNVSVGLPSDSSNSYGSTFGDLNQDGFLDLFVSNHQGADSNEIYYFIDSLNSYVDVSSSIGIGNGDRPTFCTAFFDYDLDHDLDIYVINDRTMYENSFFENNGDGTFTDISVISQTNIAIDAMNAGIGDYNLDGYFDIYVTNTGASTMFNNLGNGTFSDDATASGTIFNRVGWSGNFIDIDNDSDEDLYVCNVSPGGANPNGMFVNQGNGTFTEPLYNFFGLGGQDTFISTVNAIGDINRDGLMDIACLLKGNQKVKIWLNENYNENHFVKLDLVGVSSNIEGIGAFGEIYFNGQKRIFHKHNAQAYLNQNSDLLHIGLDTNQTVDSIVVYWPFPNSKDVYSGVNIGIDQISTLTEGSSIILVQELEPCVSQHNILYHTIPPGTYFGLEYIKADGELLSGYSYSFLSSGYTTLLPEFDVPLGATFTIEVGECEK